MRVYRPSADSAQRTGRWIAPVALALVGCGGPSTEDPAYRSLWAAARGSELTVETSPRVDKRLSVRSVSRGVADVDLRLDASAGEPEAAFELEGQPYSVIRWDLPFSPAPAILSRGIEPELAGLDLPRLVDPSVPLDVQGGMFYVGPDEDGAPCLRITVPDKLELPESFLVRYALEAAVLAGSPVLADASAEDIVRSRRLVGARTTEAFVIPAGAKLRVPLPPHGAVRFRARLSAGPANGARTVRLRVGTEAPLERVLLGDGGEVPIVTSVAAASEETWLELEVTGPVGSLIALEEPRLERAEPLPPGAAPPNVCLVIIDTLRADRLSDASLMPRMAELSNDCLVFEECWSTCSWTLPSVTTMLTSNHGGQHQAWLNDQPLAEGIDTLGEVFQRAGYRTAAFTGGVFVDQLFGLDRGFGTFDSGAGGVRAVVDRALEWVDRAGAGPWFLLVHTYEVHAPYQPPAEAFERVVARYPGVLGDRAPEPHWFHDDQGVVDGDVAAITGLLSDLYDEGVRYADGVLGDFFEGLRERGLYDAMTLAVTSDHGEEFGEHGMFGHTDSLYREQLHVPLLLHLPGGARAGEVDSRPVSHLDLAPTLFASTGGELGPQSTFEGRSLLGALTPSPIYATRHIAEIGILRAMREGDHAVVEGPYIFPRAPTGPELYDLAQDPQQAVNVFEPEVGEPYLARLRALMHEYDQPKVRAIKMSSSQVRLELQKMGYGD